MTDAVSGGISDLHLDDQGFDAIGGGARLATGRVGGDVPRYAIEISGGASGVSVLPRQAALSVESVLTMSTRGGAYGPIVA
jgi:hypothetical protein